MTESQTRGKQYTVRHWTSPQAPTRTKRAKQQCIMVYRREDLWSGWRLAIHNQWNNCNNMHNKSIFHFQEPRHNYWPILKYDTILIQQLNLRKFKREVQIKANNVDGRNSTSLVIQFVDHKENIKELKNTAPVHKKVNCFLKSMLHSWFTSIFLYD